MWPWWALESTPNQPQIFWTAVYNWKMYHFFLNAKKVWFIFEPTIAGSVLVFHGWEHVRQPIGICLVWLLVLAGDKWICTKILCRDWLNAQPLTLGIIDIISSIFFAFLNFFHKIAYFAVLSRQNFIGWWIKCFFQNRPAIRLEFLFAIG